MYSKILILAVLVLISAFFSGSETALIAVTKTKVDELVSKKVKNAKLLKKLKNNPHRLLITVLIGNNIVNVGASAYAALIFTEIFASNGIGIATGVMTFTLLVFGEITPKAFCHQHAVVVSLRIVRFIYGLQVILFPLVWFFEKIVRLVNKVFGTQQGYSVTEGEVLAMLKIGTQEGAIEKHEKELIENVFEFNDIEVEQVMTPRVNFECLDGDLSIQEAVDKVKVYTHTRIPVYEENIDHIIGILSVKELLKYFDECSGNKKLKNLKLITPIEVPLSKKINKLFREFQRKYIHIAIVIDEHGGTAGLVTLEDLLEEIVGDILDETDVPDNPFEVVNKNTILVFGSTLAEDVNDYFRLKFWPSDYDTVNTMVTEQLHRFPREGEIVRMPMGSIRILKMDKNIIKRAEIKKTKSKKV